MTRENRIWIMAFVTTAIALLGTNIWWFYSALDQASFQKYTEIEMYQCTHERAVLESLCLDLTRSTTKEEVVHLLESTLADSEPYEKHGFLNSTWVSFRFDDNGNLAQVTTDDDIVLQNEE